MMEDKSSSHYYSQACLAYLRGVWGVYPPVKINKDKKEKEKRIEKRKRKKRKREWQVDFTFMGLIHSHKIMQAAGNRKTRAAIRSHTMTANRTSARNRSDGRSTPAFIGLVRMSCLISSLFWCSFAIQNSGIELQLGGPNHTENEPQKHTFIFWCRDNPKTTIACEQWSLEWKCQA